MDKHHQIKIGEFVINYVYKKQNNHFPLVLFLHGFADSLTSFTGIANKGKTVYNYAAFDFPGCGKSSSKDNLKLSEYAYVTDEFIKKVLKDEKDIVIVSHSLGSFSALSALSNKQVKEAILFSPFNYNLNKDNREKNEQIKRWLLPSTPEDAEEAYKSFFGVVTPSVLNSAKVYSRIVMQSAEEQKRKFQWMLDNQILNNDFLEFYFKPLFFTNKNYSMVTGQQDKFTSIKELNEIADEAGVEYVTIAAGHAIFSEASEFTSNYINQKINKDKQ